MILEKRIAEFQAWVVLHGGRIEPGSNGFSQNGKPMMDLDWQRLIVKWIDSTTANGPRGFLELSMTDHSVVEMREAFKKAMKS